MLIALLRCWIESQDTFVIVTFSGTVDFLERHFRELSQKIKSSRYLSCFQGFFFLTVLNGGLHYESPIGPPRFWACFFAGTIKIWSYKQNGRITGLTNEK